MKLVTAAEMREIEEWAAIPPPGGPGLPSPVLMEAAGLGIARGIERILREQHRSRSNRVLVLVGPGNNGGDGLVVARHLHNWGAVVSLYLWARRTDGDQNYQICRALGIPDRRIEADPGLVLLERELAAADVVVDALLGTGRARPIAGPLADLLGAVHASRGQEARPASKEPLAPRQPSADRKPLIIAVDLPSGMNADTGAVDPNTMAADWTFTLGNPKRGHFQYPGAGASGCLEVVDIGIPPSLLTEIRTEVATTDAVRARLPVRPSNAHKGTFGKLLVVGGSHRYLGAPRLSALAAVRVGAGLVTLGAASSLIRTLASSALEPTFLPLPDVDDGHLASTGVDEVVSSLAGYRALLVGPGLGRHAQTEQFVLGLLDRLRSSDSPGVVIDADALNALSTRECWWEAIPAGCVLTPHSGELARLIGLRIDEIESARVEVARRIAGRTDQIIVLKGAFTVVAAPDGRATVSPFAVPALASGGTGDVLSGAIAGLLAQGLDSYDAALVGVWLHAAAGQTWTAVNGDAGLAASDLLELLPREIRSLRAANPWFPHPLGEG